jgi:two-component system, sensor histidine kinase RegB
MARVALLPPLPVDGDASARNVRLLSVLRMLAIGGQLATILLVDRVLGVPLPIAPMLAALAVLLLLNVAVAALAARRPIGDVALFATLLVDVACLTVQLYLSGGVANPFVSLFLLQVVIAAVLLPIWSSWTLAVLTSLLFAWLAWSPFQLPPAFGARLSPPYAAAAWLSFTLAAALLVLFVTRIVRNLAEREARLAALRQRAAEEEHVVRLGLLASGAAHELGTPLASLAVMLGDWRREPEIARIPDLAADVEAMAGEVARCKAILGQVLMAAGEVRGDSPVRTTLRQFVADTIGTWRQANDVAVTLDDAGVADEPIIADRPLAQTVVNLLDNAVDAGAGHVEVCLARSGDQVTIRVRDDGRGFVTGMLADIGKPYRSTKQRPGAGLGLFLASNVLRTLGGSVAARNGDRGGAEVTLTWPLAAITVPA